MLTCFFAGARPTPAPLEPPPLAAGFRFLARLDVVDGELLVLRVLRLARLVVVDLTPVFFRISLIALLTMPEIKVSMTPDIAAPP